MSELANGTRTSTHARRRINIYICLRMNLHVYRDSLSVVITVFGKPQILCALLYWPWHYPKKSALCAVFVVVMPTTNWFMYELMCIPWFPFCCYACSCIGIDIFLYPRFHACTRMHAQTDRDTCLLICTHQYIDEDLARRFTHTITHTHTGT